MNQLSFGKTEIMKKNVLIILIVVFPMLMFAQSNKGTFGLHPSSQKLYNTEIKLDGYQLKKAETINDLVLNVSYSYHINNGFTGTYLNTPVVLINEKPVDYSMLNELHYSKVKDFEFLTGIKVQAIYGTSAFYGLLKITLKDEE